MGTNAYYLNQFISTTLATVGGIDDSQTTGIILTSVTGVETTKPGIVCLSYSDPIDTSKAEWVSYTSISVTNELQGVTRGAEGFSAKSHSNGVTIAFPISESHINNLNDALIIGGSATNLATGVIDDDTFATASATTLATSESIKNFVGNGWTPALETWTYASATRITVPSGATSKYQKGDKIKLTQTTVKYFYIVGVADTLLTITGGSSYTLTNATITNNYYSKVENPQGFPRTLAYPICTAFTSSQLTSTTDYIVPLNNEAIDTHNMHNTSTNNSRIVIPMDGVYLIIAQAFFAHQADGYRQLTILVNGSDSSFSTKKELQPSSFVTGRLQAVANISLTTNDYVEMKFTHNSASSIDLFTTLTRLSVSRIG